jgi:hypothetical protein
MLLFVRSRWRKFPIEVFGYDIRLWERGYGQESYDPTLERKFVFMKYRTYEGPTHLQKFSPFGFLIQWPLCFHVWYQFHGQINGQPGTEKVFYFRVGWTRWDAGDMIYMFEKFGFGTWYGPGLHWD